MARPKHAKRRPAAHGPRTSPSAGALADRLIPWFRHQARDLPWRRTRDPYGIWVSEIMLQQTQVKTVIPYWERWMRRFPDVAALASALEDVVLKHWEGLGYYSRARNLHRAARVIVEQYGGVLPSEVDTLLTLPGIGRYTAGAIASVAFNRPAPLVDGNVIRVLTRVHEVGGDPKSRVVNDRLWELAGDLVTEAVRVAPDAQGCGDLNQALMELGATICTPLAPACGICPVRLHCGAQRTGDELRYPELPPRVASTPRWFATALLSFEGRWLVQQRPKDAVNAGFWEFPNIELAGAGSDPARALEEWLGVPATAFESAGELRHSITRYRMTQRLQQAAVTAVVAKRLLQGTRLWASPEELEHLHLTGPHRKLVRTLSGTIHGR